MKAVFLCGLIISLLAGGEATRGAENLFAGPPEYLIHPDPPAELEKVLALEKSSQWMPLSDVNPGLGNPLKRIWFRIKIDGSQVSRPPVFLEIPSLYIDTILLFVPDRTAPSGYTVERTGLLVPVGKRSVPVGTFLLRFDPPRRGAFTVYLRLDAEQPTQTPFVLMDSDAYLFRVWNKRVFLGMFLGFLIFACLIGLTFGTFLKNSLLATFGFMVLGYTLLFVCSEGISTEYLWPNNTSWSRLEAHTTGGIVIFAMVLFARRFLETRKHCRWIDHMYLVILAISTMRSIWLFIDFNNTIALIGQISAIAMNVANIVAGVACFRKTWTARYFLAGTSFFSVTMAYYISSSSILTERSAFMEYAPHFGVAFQILIFSMGLFEWTKRLVQEFNQQRLAMVQSEKMSVLDQMAGGIAHEINNPLAIIKLNTDRLLMGVDTKDLDEETIREIGSRINRTIIRISKIVRLMRSFVRAESDEPLQEMSLKSLIDETLLMCSDRFRNAGIELRKESIPESIRVQCQPVALTQLILNLLNNAYDAVETLPAPGRWIALAFQIQKGTVRISISNAGPIIDPEIQRHMFDPFFTTKDIGKGSGLGLSIARSIAETHGGTLQYDIETGYSRFTLTLRS